MNRYAKLHIRYEEHTPTITSTSLLVACIRKTHFKFISQLQKFIKQNHNYSPFPSELVERATFPKCMQIQITDMDQ